MQIPGEVMEAIVKEASESMADPAFTDTLVGGFIRSQPSVAQYLTAKQARLGGAEGVMNVVFHAALLARTVRKHTGRPLATIGFDDLDFAASSDRDERLNKRQPAFAAYLESNIEEDEAKRTLVLLALAIDRALNPLG